MLSHLVAVLSAVMDGFIESNRIPELQPKNLDTTADGFLLLWIRNIIKHWDAI